MLHRTIAICTCTLLAVSACSSDDGDEGAAPTTADVTSTTEVLVLDILVTNDDGIGALGIDVLVEALGQMADVDVQIVAPAENQSGSSDKTTPGGATYADAQTASGVAGTAVDGFPADTITVALDELGLEPDVVVSGINKGQNVGPLAYDSGTVGAARAAVRRGIPAIAGSAGLTEDTVEDYELAAELVVDQVEEIRESLAGGDGGAGEVANVVNINVPDCIEGTAKELVEVDLATEIPQGVNPFATPDCSVTDSDQPADDVLAVAGGYSALSLVPPEEPSG